MKCSEIVSPFKCYQVNVHLKTGMTGKTLVFAENPAFARNLAMLLYGDNNVLLVIVSEEATPHQTTPKPVDPDQQRIKALSDQKKQVSQQLKTVRAQSKLKKAQRALQSARRPKPVS